MIYHLSYALGWIPDRPDSRDSIESSPAIAALLERRDRKVRDRTLPSRVDLRRFCPPPMAQGSLNSCSAHAAVAAVEIGEKKAHGEYTPGSRLFVYKASRNLQLSTGDTGTPLRSAMQALVTCGLPPEKYWPYNPAMVDVEPPAFSYALANDCKALHYFRHDPPRAAKLTVVNRIKRHLAHGTPAMFGTLLFESFKSVETSGYFPLPTSHEDAIGAHAMLAVGYDDRIKPRRAQDADPASSSGAFLVLNSWGSNWGFGGFGWLPYDYVLRDLATDWWSVLHESWIDIAPFDPA